MHVVIVGGGIVGTSLAARLASEDAVEVTLCERDTLGAGTTSASAAVFATQQSDPEAVDDALRQRSWATYGPLVEDGTLSFQQVGEVTVADTPSSATALRSAVEPLREFGHDAEWVDAGDFDQFDLSPADHEGALYTPATGYFHVDELVEHFAEVARERGAEIRDGDGVVDVRTDDQGAVSAVETEAEVIPADAVVNAAGPWALGVNDFVGVDAPLRHTVGPILVLDGEDNGLPFAVFESTHYVRPVGSDGAYIGKYRTEYADGEVLDPDAPTDVLDAFHEEARDFLAASVPALADAEVVDEWVGLRTVTPDGRPIVGESTVPGFYLAVGMSGLGVTLAPAVAAVLTAEIAGDGSALAEPLAPERF
jgi:sarcosine oxidase subunit beta